MERLTTEQQLELVRFEERLDAVVGPEDMFPPDASGTLAYLEPRLPIVPAAEAVDLALVYNLAAARYRRELLGQQSAETVTRIGLLVDQR